MNKRNLTVLIVIFFFGYLLRVLFLPQGSLTFGYDQARDAYVSQQILSGDLKILGPPASTPGLYHGVLYYYILAPGYMFTDSPIHAAYWMAFVSMLSLFVIFFIGYYLTGKAKVGLLASFLFAISFESSQYAIWLSNPTIGILTVPLIYLGLWMWIKKRGKYGAIITGLGLGASVQAEVFLLYHTVPLLIMLFAESKNIKKIDFVKFTTTLILSVSTMILVEFKFGFRGLSGAMSLLSTGEPVGSAKSLGDIVVLYLNQLGKVLAFSSYPGNIGYGSMFIFALVIFGLYQWDKKKISWQPFLALWIFSHLTVVSVGGTSTPFLLVGIGPAVSILIAIYINKWWKWNRVIAALVMVAIFYGNVSMILKENPRGQTIFSIQKDMLIGKQTKAIDFTYDEAAGEMFSVNTLTSPLWINIVWTYMYNWYGASNYGYTPEWHGKDQVGQLATLSNVSENTRRYFLILEPPAGIPLRYLDETIRDENNFSSLEDEIYVGEIRVQKRLKIDE